MKGLALCIWVLFSVSSLPGANCQHDIEFVISKIRGIDRDISRLQDRFGEDIHFAMATLRSELTQKVSDAVTQILQGQSVADIVRHQVVSETRHLKHENQQMKRQLLNLRKTVSDVSADRNLYQGK